MVISLLMVCVAVIVSQNFDTFIVTGSGRALLTTNAKGGISYTCEVYRMMHRREEKKQQPNKQQERRKKKLPQKSFTQLCGRLKKTDKTKNAN